MVTWLWPVPKALLAVVLLWILSQRAQEPVKLKHSNKWVLSNITRTSKMKFCLNFIPQVHNMLTDVSSITCWKILVLGFLSVASCFNVIVWACTAPPPTPLTPLDRWRIDYHTLHTQAFGIWFLPYHFISRSWMCTLCRTWLVRTNAEPVPIYSIEIFFITVQS